MIQEAGFHLLGPLQRAGSRFLPWFEPHVAGVMEIWTWPGGQLEKHTFGCIQQCNKCTEGARGSPQPRVGISPNQDPKHHFSPQTQPSTLREQHQNKRRGKTPPPLQEPGLRYSLQPNASSSANVIVKVNLEAAFPPILKRDEPPQQQERGRSPEPPPAVTPPPLQWLQPLNVPPALDATTLRATPDASRLGCPPH